VKWVAFFGALFVGVPLLRAVLARDPRARALAITFVCFDLFNPMHINLISQETYRGDSRGIEITTVDSRPTPLRRDAQPSRGRAVLRERPRDRRRPCLLAATPRARSPPRAAKHAGLIIGAVEHGFADESSRARFLSKLSAIGGVVLVGMGTPIQERWAWEHLASITGITVLTVGGLFDFYSGRIPRAPMALREVGLEWTWRLWQEPTRLARRYLVGNPVFLSRALAQRARGRPR